LVAAIRSAGARWTLTPCAPPPIATIGRSTIEASTITGQSRLEPNGVIVPRGYPVTVCASSWSGSDIRFTPR